MTHLINKAFLLGLLLCQLAIGDAFFKNDSLIEVMSTTATSGGTTTLGATSDKHQQFTGAAAHTVVLPNATTLPNGRAFFVSNKSLGTVSLEFNDNSTATTLDTGDAATVRLLDNSSSNGTWNVSKSVENAGITVETDPLALHTDGSKLLTAALLASQVVTPPAAGVGQNRLYFKSDEFLYQIGNTSPERAIGWVVPNAGSLLVAATPVAMTGTNNTFIGETVGDGITTGGNNVAVGTDALSASNSTNASANTAIGFGALAANRAANNVAIGSEAALNLTGGTNAKNVYIGSRSGIISTVGEDNVAVGYNTMAAGNGSDMTAIGSSAGNGSTASLSVFLGATAGQNHFGTQSIAIGAGATPTTGPVFTTNTVDNEMVIGSQDAPITHIYLGEGGKSTTPQQVTIQNSQASGTNIAGASTALAGGRGTGSAAGGTLLFQTAAGGGAGSTVNPLVTHLELGADGRFDFKNRDLGEIDKIEIDDGSSNEFIIEQAYNEGILVRSTAGTSAFFVFAGNPDDGTADVSMAVARQSAATGGQFEHMNFAYRSGANVFSIDQDAFTGGVVRPMQISATGGSNSQIRLETNGNVLIGQGDLNVAGGNINITGGNDIIIDAFKVLDARRTGWTVATGTATRSAFDTTTVTTQQLAERVKALIDDLHATAGHGLIGN